MSFRQQLSLAVVVILLLFSVNVGVDLWSTQKHRSSITLLDQAVSGQLKVAALKQEIIDQSKTVLLMGSLRFTLNEKLSPREMKQNLSDISSLEIHIQQLREHIPNTIEAYSKLEENAVVLISLWRKFYRNYNDDNYDHYPEAGDRKQRYQQIIENLLVLEELQIRTADQHTTSIRDVDSLTSRISIAVFLFSIFLSVSLGLLLIRYTTGALERLQKGTVIIGSGNLDYRIPVNSQDELGGLAEAFNSMSVKLQRAMKDARIAKETADQASQAKSDFLANMSHELRTPLHSIIGYGEMMLEDIEFGENETQEQIKDLNKLLTAGRQLFNQINDILDLSKIETGKMTLHKQPFDCIAALQEVTDFLAPLAEHAANQIVFEPQQELPLLYNDATKFRQIFLNLLSNACKFTEHGTITLFAEHIEKPSPALRFRVADNGIGMTADQTSIVFEAFEQAESSTSQKYGGTGLGLTLCKQFCELMGATIKVDSTFAKGTTFTVDFPLAPPCDKHIVTITRALE